ncbi:hypothetical protein KCP74_18280 [Salmonella enterica subsp. enterica]|nr:hypothetical protein KCP74_18280 [Salmonella enterica subsp. enterica]
MAHGAKVLCRNGFTNGRSRMSQKNAEGFLRWWRRLLVKRQVAGALSSEPVAAAMAMIRYHH